LIIAPADALLIADVNTEEKLLKSSSSSSSSSSSKSSKKSIGDAPSNNNNKQPSPVVITPLNLAENSMEESSLEALEVIEVDNEDDHGRLGQDKLVNATDTTTTAPVEDTGPKHNYFEILPDELVVRVFSYLKERELFRVAEVDNRFHQMSFDTDLWEEKAKRWHAGAGAASIPRNKSYFLQKFKEEERWIRAEADRLAREEQIRKDTAKQQKRREKAAGCERFMRVMMFTRVSDYFTIGALLLGTIFLVIKLDGAVNWEWPIVLIPFFVLAGQVIIATFTHDAARVKYDEELADNIAPQRISVWEIFMKVPCRMMIHTAIVLLIAFFVLLGLKLSNLDLIPWWAVFLPLWVLCILASQAPLTGCVTGTKFSEGDYKFERVMFGIFALFLLAFFILLWLKLDFYVRFNWWIVFIPIWVIMGTFVIVPSVLLFLYYCCGREAWLRQNTILREDRILVLLIVLGCWAVLLAPIFSFLYLMIYNVEGNEVPRTYAIVFVPILLLEGIIVAGCGVADIVDACRH
jgi:hypothetical protein